MKKKKIPLCPKCNKLCNLFTGGLIGTDLNTYKCTRCNESVIDINYETIETKSGCMDIAQPK
jgi:hypothetical protein